jgi:hypothetical protein
VAAGAWWTSPGSTRARHALVVLVVFALPVAAWGIRNRLMMGEVILTATVSGGATWGANNPVTAGVAPPAIPEVKGFDLLAEAREGRYLGSWIPMEYIPGWNPPGGTELDVFHHQLDSTHAFLLGNPRAALALLAHKLVRLITDEPYAPSITNDVGVRRRIHRVTTFLEYWCVLLAGGAGLLILHRSRPPAARWCGAFFVAGIASVLVTYPNPRFLLPATTVLLAPAALALVRTRDVLRGPAARPTAG